MTPRRLWLALTALFLLASAFFIHAQDSGPLYTLPAATAPLSVSGTMDLSGNGRLIVATNMLNDSVSIVDIAARTLQAEVLVGDDPRGVSFSPDNTLALVANRGDGTLMVIDVAVQTIINRFPVGAWPYGVVTTSDSLAYVSLQGTDEVIQINYLTGDILARISTPPMPTGLTLWGNDFLYVTHLWTGDVSMVYIPQYQVVRTISLGSNANLNLMLTIDRSAGIAYLPFTRIYPGNPALTYDSAAFPRLEALDLRTMDFVPDAEIPLDIADRPVNLPSAVAVDPFRDLAFITNAGTDDVSIINLTTGQVVANIPVGTNPRAAILSSDNVFLYVHNTLEGAITVVDTRGLSVQDVLPISDLRVPIDLLLGAEYFHSAADPLMGERTLSCANCHFDGLSDGRVWATMEAEAFNTPILFDLIDTAPYNWHGTWDELTDVELKIRSLQFGEGLLDDTPNAPLGDPHGGLSLDLDILATYTASLTGPGSTVESSPLIEAGAEVFERLECATCHTGYSGTDNLLHDVGTGGEINTPTLNYLWQSAPYLHDGRARTLDSVFILPGDHQLNAQLTPEEIAALTAYLLARPLADQ